MKKIKLSYFCSALFVIFCVLAANNMAVTYPDGPPTNRCGLYGTQPTCTACHSASGTNNATASLALSGNPSNYELGQTYTITVTATGGLSYGFEMAAVRNDNNANAGTLAAGSGTETANGTVSGNSISFIRQNTPNNAGTWTFNWTAPATNVGTVSFYLAILATNTTNGTGSNSGDKTKTATLSLPAPASCPTLSVGIAGNTAICSGQSTTLTASGGATYVWNNGTTNAANSISVAGVYTVTATDANNCTGTATASVSSSAAPNAIISGNNSICTGQSTSFMASGGDTYAWNNGTTTASNTVSAAGVYTVTVTNAAGCTATATRSLTVNAAPNAVATSTPNAVCEGQLVMLAASGGGTYAWSNGANSANTSDTPTSATTYTVTVTDANGCSDTATRTVSVNAAPNAAISGSTEICAGQSTSLNASGGGTYAWNNGTTTASNSVSAAGVYTVTVTDANGCSDQAQVSITQIPNPSPNITQSGDTCAGGTAIYAISNPGLAGTQYVWSVSGGTITAGQGTSSVTIMWGAAGAGSVNVEQTNQ